MSVDNALLSADTTAMSADNGFPSTDGMVRSTDNSAMWSPRHRTALTTTSPTPTAPRMPLADSGLTLGVPNSGAAGEVRMDGGCASLALSITRCEDGLRHDSPPSRR